MVTAMMLSYTGVVRSSDTNRKMIVCRMYTGEETDCIFTANSQLFPHTKSCVL